MNAAGKMESAGVAAIGRVLSLFVELGDDLRERHFIWLTHAHIDDLCARIGVESRLFGALDLLKFVDGSVFAVFNTADPFSKQILNIAFGHCK